MTLDYLSLADSRIAYQRQVGEKKSPGILFLGGYVSDMTGSKATFLSAQAKKKRKSFLRFDYRGHGRSSGDFFEMTIGDWLQDALAVFDKLTAGPQIIVGSSMGGWMGLLLAKARPKRIKAFIGVAAAPDFTEDLVWKRLSPSARKKIQQTGVHYESDAFRGHKVPFTMKLIKEGRKHLVLRSPLRLPCPVRLLQGMKDPDVPWEYAPHIAKKLLADDIRVTLIKDGGHSLSEPENLRLLWHTIEEFL